MDEVPDGGTFLDAVLSLVPEEDWQDLIAHALQAREAGPNGAADSVIAYGVLQRPQALHPHLERIFSVCPNEGTYYENWPWRESGTANLAFLQGHFARRPAAARLKAWRAMLETRDPYVLDTAVDLARSLQLPHGQKLDDYLTLIGFELQRGALRRLYPDGLFHIAFSGTDSGSAEWWMRAHPTWNLPTRGHQKARLGGRGAGDCTSCGGRLHHLLTLDPVPTGLGVTGLDTLSLVACLSCLGWEQERMFFAHDAHGTASGLGDAKRITPQFPAKGLEPARVHLVPTPSRWHWQDWALSNSRENLHRLGGSPCWIQGAQFPVCPRCSRRMGFLLQLDSNLPTQGGDEWLWGSGGIAYGFWCDRCRVSGFLWQCT